MSRAIGSLDHWTLAVSDLTLSAAFYRDVMGWHALPDDQVSTRRLVRDGQRVELESPHEIARHVVPAPQVHHLGLSHLTVATGPTPELLAELRQRDVRVREHTRSSFVPDSEDPGNQFLFEDPDGNLIETYTADDEWNSFAGMGGSEAHACSTGIAHLSHWSLCVADPRRSLPFYRDVLGWEEIAVFDWAGEGPSRVMDVGPAQLTTWLLVSGDQRIEIIHFTQPSVTRRAGSGRFNTGLSHLTVIVEDAAEAAAELSTHGIDVSVQRAADGDAIVFCDPDQNWIRGIPPSRAWQ